MNALQEATLRLAQLVSDFDAIQELDLNPVLALTAGEGYRAVDARVILATSPNGASVGSVSSTRSARPGP